MTRVTLVVDKNFAIGESGDMLFPIPEDMQKSKELTMGNIVIMGRKTLGSLPNSGPLPSKTSITIMNRDLDGMLCTKNEEELLRTLEEINLDHEMTEYLIGSTNTVESLIHLVGEFVITYADCEFEYGVKIRNLFEDQDFYVSEGLDIKSYEDLDHRYMVFKGRQEKEHCTFMLRISYGKNCFDFKSKKSIKESYRVNKTCLRFQSFETQKSIIFAVQIFYFLCTFPSPRD